MAPEGAAWAVSSSGRLSPGISLGFASGEEEAWAPEPIWSAANPILIPVSSILWSSHYNNCAFILYVCEQVFTTFQELHDVAVRCQLCGWS
jgi:hypothetical protein